jgi:hypothetical protein
MWKRNLFFVVAICASFYLGVCGAGYLLAGPCWMSCEGGALCPAWQCVYTKPNGILSTCSTCGWPGTTCTPGPCGQCEVNYFSPCCRDANSCAGQDLTDPNMPECSCSAAGYSGNSKLLSPYCWRKPSIWTLFAFR